MRILFTSPDSSDFQIAKNQEQIDFLKSKQYLEVDKRVLLSFDNTKQIISDEKNINTAKFLGILFHRDSETSNDNYIAFVYGDTVEEVNNRFKLLNTPRYTEETKILEFGKNIKSELHKMLLNQELDFYWYSENHFWCRDNLDELLELNFSQSKTMCFMQ